MARKSHVFLLLSSLCLFSAVSTAVFLSYDCGSSDLIYTDGNGIVWTGDDTLMGNNGIPQVVQPSNSMSQVMDTLRVFTTRNKNCYSINIDISGQQILVRASFYYGNYDKKSSPPSFDLQFDGNDWATVRTMSDGVVYYEVIYVAERDYTSVCLAQTLPDQFPFISALEVRSLDATMYGNISANYALFLSRRVAYGISETVRYADDVYDRIWSPMPGGNNGLIPVSISESLFIDNNGGDNPPEEVLKNAITTSNTSEFIQLGTSFPQLEVPVYMTMYFSEVTQLDDSTQKRFFTVYKGNESFSSIISPPYGNFTEMVISNVTVSSNTKFYLVATPDSTLPPLINAMEVFFISDPLTKGTNTKDMDGISSLQSDFEALEDWGGDPCLPAPYSWDWLNCSDDSIPRITALYLSSFDLSGSLPDFSSMDSLEIIDLSNNSLTGQIPEFLGTFPNLKQLDLSDNLFSGPVPTSLSNKNNLNLVVTGNPDLCSSTSDNSCQTRSPSGSSNRPRAGDSYYNNNNKKKSTKLPIILGTAIPVFILIWAVVGILTILHHNKRKAVAMVAANPGQTAGGGGNMSPMPLLNPRMMGNGGEVAMNEIKVDTNQTAQQAN